MFHHLTYEGSVDLNKIQDPIQRRAIEIQVNEYGQTPKQIFKNPHPKRFSNKITEIFLIEENINTDNITNEEDNKIEISSSKRNSYSVKEDYNESENITDKDKDDILNLKSFAEEIEKEVVFNFERNYSLLQKFHKK